MGKKKKTKRQKHVSANISTTAKKWMCQFLLLPNEESSLWQTILLLLLWSLPWVMIPRIPCITYFRVDWQHLFVISKAIIGISKDLQLSLNIMTIQFSCIYICYFLFLTAIPKSAKTNFSCFVWYWMIGHKVFFKSWFYLFMMGFQNMYFICSRWLLMSIKCLTSHDVLLQSQDNKSE